MEARRRQPSASISVKSEDTKAHVRRGSHSATPLDDEDGENSRRSTRGRNPLPPSKGPLFPPLPPKQPKPRSNSMHLAPPSPRPNSTSPRAAPKSPATIPIDPALADASGEDGEVDPPKAASPGATRDEAGPSGSVVSLTPPPPTSEDAAADVDMDMAPAAEVEDATSGLTEPDSGDAEVKGDEQWEEGQRPHSVRSFPNASEVKQEQDVDDETTPRKASAAQDDAVIDPDASPPPIERADSSKLNRKRRGEEQLLLDDHLLPAEMRRTGSLNGKRGKGKEEEEEEDTIEAADDEDPDGEDAPEDITRCVCKLDDEDLMMIQCDDCNVWQHGPCMGIWADDEAPDEYYCEQCRPDLHGPLRKWIRSKGRNATYIPPPTPADLQRLHHPSDKHPPSQSKRWTDPALNLPPAPPPKPPVRSHHRKEATSPVDPTDGRRGSQGGARKPPPAREKPPPPPAPEKPESKKKVVEGTSRRGVTVASPSPSRSPPPNSAAAAALKKRRSTMNSRYDDEVYAVMEASRMDQTGDKEMEEETIVAHEEVSEDKLAPRKGKRKREDDEASEAGGTPAPSLGKPKHPNQYTYRPKPVSTTQAVASPMRRVPQGSTPVPSLPPPAQHDHGTRRAGAIANGTIPPPPNSYTVNNLHWHLPDHLASFADIFPTPEPVALEPRMSRSMAYLPRNHFLNQRYGPFSEDRDDEGRLLLPENPGTRETSGDPVTQLEPPARVRYPTKRITTAEIRKRVRNMLEYVSRVQQEEAKRKQRAETIGIDIKAVPVSRRKGKENEQPRDESTGEHDAPQLSMRYGEGVSSEQLMDELMRDLIGFQESFSLGGGLGVSPMPPTIATFSSAPVTPAFPSAATFGTADALDAPALAEALGRESDCAAVYTDEAGSGREEGAGGDALVGVTYGETAQADSLAVNGTNGSTGLASGESIADATSPQAPAGSELVGQAAGDLVSAGIDVGTTQLEPDSDAARDGLIGDTTADDSAMDMDVDTDTAAAPTDEPVKGLLGLPSQLDTLDPTAGDADLSPIDPELLAQGGADGLVAVTSGVNTQSTDEMQPPVEVYREGGVEEVVTAPEEVDVGPEGLAA